MRQWISAVLASAVLGASPAWAQQQGVTANTIVLGAHGAITGPLAYGGIAGRDGMLLAIKEINAAGGVNGRKLTAIMEDDASTPTRALAAAKKLVEQDKVFAVVSLGGSNSTIGAINYMKESGAVYYVSIASAPPVTWPFTRTMFRGGTTESARYGELYADLLASHHKARRIAIMSGREEYARNEALATIAKLKEWFALEPVARAEFNVGDKDFTPQLVEVQKSNPDVIAFFGNPAEGLIALRQAKELGLRQPFFVGSNMVDQSFAASAGANAERVTGFSLIPLLPGSDAAAMKQWEAAWKREYPNAPPGRPNQFDLLGYGDTYVLAEAMKRAGPNLTTDSLIQALEGMQDYRSSAVVSTRSFSKRHHIGNLNLTPMMAKDGKWVPLDWTGSRPSDILKRYN
ncbi:MAG: ABC transporter substrate-binding protein [Pseudomonadota bacterium]